MIIIMGKINRIWRLDQEPAKFKRLCDTVLERVMIYGKEQGMPETACVLQRGGSVPVRYIADAMGIHTVYSLGLSSYGGDLGKNSEIKIYQDIPNEASWETLITIDDVFDSGKTAEFVDGHLNRKSVSFDGKYILVAPLIKPPAHELLRHIEERIFYAEECPADTWVVFPYEASETIQKLHKSVTDPEKSPEECEYFKKLVQDGFNHREIKKSFIFRGKDVNEAAIYGI